MRAELHCAGFQIHAFITRVARNWPQSNDGQSQHFCPAASHIINQYQAHWLWKSGLFQETYFLTVCFSKYVISFPFHWEVITHSLHSDFSSFFEDMAGSNSFKQCTPSVNTLYLPTISEVSFMGFLLLLCFNYFPFLHIQQKMEKNKRGGYITSTSNIVCKTHLQDFKTKMQTSDNAVKEKNMTT